MALFSSDHYLMGVTWKDSSQFLATWLNRPQNISLLAIYDATRGVCVNVSIFRAIYEGKLGEIILYLIGACMLLLMHYGQKNYQFFLKYLYIRKGARSCQMNLKIYLFHCQN